MVAARKEREYMAMRLLEFEAEFKDGPNDEEFTILSYFAEGGMIDAMKAINSLGASFDGFDKNLNTLLHFAAMTNRLEMVGFLLDNGVRSNIKNRQGNLPENLTTS